MADDNNLWVENEQGLKYFVQIGVSIEAIFRFCRLVAGARLTLRNVPLHLFKNSFTFTNPCQIFQLSSSHEFNFNNSEEWQQDDRSHMKGLDQDVLKSICDLFKPSRLWVGDHFIQGRNANNEVEQSKYCMMASQIPHIELFDLSELQITSSVHLKPLFEQHFSCLKYLNLKKCGLTRTHMYEIVEMIAETAANRSLEWLNFSENSCF